VHLRKTTRNSTLRDKKKDLLFLLKDVSGEIPKQFYTFKEFLKKSFLRGRFEGHGLDPVTKETTGVSRWLGWTPERLLGPTNCLTFLLSKRPLIV
jgi:hypothetical protein